jgi:methionyl-tRNA formyltransferase
MTIHLKLTLRETVVYNYARLYEASAKGLAKVVKDFPQFADSAKPQAGGRSFTTPSFWQYLRMVYQHRRLYREQLKQTVTRS